MSAHTCMIGNVVGSKLQMLQTATVRKQRLRQAWAKPPQNVA